MHRPVNANEDRRHMARALELAKKGLYTTDPNPRVGCVLVRDTHVLGEGWHEYAGGPHAEINALARAGESAHGATAYVTLEPCCHQGLTGPCTEALIRAGVRRVVAAMVDPNPQVAGQGLRALEAGGIVVECGLLEREARKLNVGFVSRMQRGRPFVRCKLAMSLDGRTAMATGESQWITGAPARQDVQRLRARSSAILTGIGTVLADDPSLNVRWQELDESSPPLRQPLRIVLDPQLQISPRAKLLQLPGRTLIVTTSDSAQRRIELLAAGAEIVSLPGTPDAIDLSALMSLLADRAANEVLLESGATLSGAMLRAGLIDELVIYAAPLLLGSGARGLFQLPELRRMEQRIALKINDIRAVGKDWRFTAQIQD
ncbi:MAG: bifunctional diaminohydroxyphosphoribosylaminopyrimidine deaminase/5-amino-6-(5-phosphoribosylamino)uracil reductase RibD [Gammaproteobacteria bacterium]